MTRPNLRYPGTFVFGAAAKEAFFFLVECRISLGLRA